MHYTDYLYKVNSQLLMNDDFNLLKYHFVEHYNGSSQINLLNK
jgi:hypothetical protein